MNVYSTLLKNLTLSCSLFVSISLADAQSTFIETYGGAAYEMGNWLCKTSDGGYILTGQSMSFGDTDGDIYVVKTSSAGTEEWEKHFGSTELDGGNCIIESPDGGYLVIGHTEGWGNGDCEAYILKLNSFGDSLWLRTLGDIYDDAAYCGINSSDNTYVISGILQAPATQQSHAFLAKYDLDGNLLWEKTYGAGPNESAKQVVQSPDGGYVLAGYSPGEINPALFNAFLAKTDIDGNEIWEKTFNADSTEKINNIAITPDGNFLLSGYITNVDTDSDIFLVETDSAGNELWKKSITNSGNDDARGLCMSNDGGIVITGTTHSVSDTSEDIFLMKLTSDGNPIWEKYFGGNQMDLGRCLINDGNGFAITGVITTDSDANLPLIRTDGEGNITGIGSMNQQTVYVSVFPNPVANEFTVAINTNQSSSCTLQVTDVTGKIMLKTYAPASLLSINCNQWSGGIYFLKMEDTQTGLQSVCKIVKK